MKRSTIVIIAVAGVAAVALGWAAFGAGEPSGGIPVGKGGAAIVVADQPDARGEIVVDKVVAPAAAFVVVHQDLGGMPGERVGYVSVPEGTTRDVKVTLDKDAKLTPKLIAAVHADKGVSGKLEFDMEDMMGSPDRPFFVEGVEVARSFTAAEFGIPAKMSEAAISAADQPLGDSVTIGSATAPAAAFVVVHKATDEGMPGERVGYAPIASGENRGVVVKLSEKLAANTKLLAAIHADRGTTGTLEFDMDSPVASPDQPYFADGMEVAAAFAVAPFGVKVASASLEATDQVGATQTITIERVEAPEDAWVVVHKEVDGAPGPRVGLARVKKGTSSAVKVDLATGTLTERLLVALHADRGTPEQFDFDMDDKFGEASSDQPFFVDGEEVAVAVKVRPFGYPTPTGTSVIQVSDQVVRNGLLQVTLASAPGPAWIVVHQDAGGTPGARVGLLHIPAGVTRGAVVQLDASKRLTDTLFVAVHADQGTPGMFEFDMMDRTNSFDQPYFVDGAEVAAGASIR